ncbi:MAG: hypothetical protein WBP08_01275 [Saprospiraceae bacterium]
MKNIYIIIALTFVGQIIKTQNISDVVRWSSIDYVGTARTIGVGSSFGAMGGDFSVININPAGIADYRVSEFMLTPSLRGFNVDAAFDKAMTSTQNKKGSSLGLDNLGFVIAKRPGGNWTSSNFAIGYSRTADLQRNVLVSGKINGSITTYFAEQANGKVVDDLDDYIAYPAYNTGAIYDFDKDNYYETDFLNLGQKIFRQQELIQKGGINELTFGWAGEYKSNMNFGLSVGVPFASFEELKTYTENDPSDEIPVFSSLEYIERLNTSGVGFNFKAGFTYKIAKKIRLAGAFHSPTWYRFTDDYSSSMTYSFIDQKQETYSYDSGDGTFEYKITTPWRAIGSLGTTYRVGDVVGFVNADIEHLDYTNANYNGTAFNSSPEEQKWTNEVNGQIQKRLGSATNLRLGTEVGYKNLRLRAGYSWERTAFNADDFYNNKVSFGIGFREDNFFMDLGFRVAQYSEGYNPYVVLDRELDPLAVIDTKRTRMALTLGFKF